MIRVVKLVLATLIFSVLSATSCYCISGAIQRNIAKLRAERKVLINQRDLLPKGQNLSQVQKKRRRLLLKEIARLNEKIMRLNKNLRAAQRRGE